MRRLSQLNPKALDAFPEKVNDDTCLQCRIQSVESPEDDSEPLRLSALAVIKKFLASVEPDSLDKLLHEYTPHAQDQMLALLAEAASRLADYVVTKQSINV